MSVKDIFDGEDIEQAGIYEDGDFTFPTDFLHYYEKYDIGIPIEYEHYIAKEIRKCKNYTKRKENTTIYRKRFLTVIKNDIGLSEYNNGVDCSENMAVHELPQAEFEELYKNGVFKKINESCGLMIDDYESEIINNDKLNICLDIISKIDSKVFLETLKDAKENGFALAIDF
ncbi:MAG: hypothetical protein UHU19_00015 [Lachnospiraceae bacterium]|nr:hypothetical protein [Lachnospiraceae bacterium]